MKTILIVKALLLDAEGRLLVLRRSGTHPTLAYHHDIPGGVVDPGEEPAAALVREIKEETGLSLKPQECVLAFTGTEDWHNDSRIRMLYVVRLKQRQPEVTISWEHDQATWMAMAEIPKIEHEYTPFYREAFHYVQKNDILNDL